jgi:uncharacterized membrane protein
MKPLIVLLAAFVFAFFAIKIFVQRNDYAWAARIAMSCMLVFTAIGHFAFPKGMAMMLPDFIPFKLPVVYATGIIEIAAAIGLQIPAMISTTGFWLTIFFILILPANIYAAMKHVDYQKANNEGKGLQYLLFRIPAQIFYIGWVYFSCF